MVIKILSLQHFTFFGNVANKLTFHYPLYHFYVIKVTRVVAKKTQFHVFTYFKELKENVKER